MASEVHGIVYGGWDAGIDMRTTGQNRFVRLSATTDRQVVTVDGAGQRAAGVLLNEPNTAEAAKVQIDGIAKVEAAAAITRGDAVAASANGRAQTAVATNAIQGVACASVTGAGELCEVLLIRQGDE